MVCVGLLPWRSIRAFDKDGAGRAHPLDRIDLVLSRSLVPYAYIAPAPPTRNILQGGTRAVPVRCTYNTTHHQNALLRFSHRLCLTDGFAAAAGVVVAAAATPRCIDDRRRRTRFVGRPPILRQVVAIRILPAHPFRAFSDEQSNINITTGIPI